LLNLSAMASGCRSASILKHILGYCYDDYSLIHPNNIPQDGSLRHPEAYFDIKC